MPDLLHVGALSARDGEGRTLFDGVEVTLADGECVTLEGPSGSGKTSLLRRLAAVEPAGDVDRVLDGESYPRDRLSEWRSRVTLLAQDAPALPGTVADNLRFPFRLKAGRDRPFDPERMRRLLAEVGLGGVPTDREVRSLSGGERHRLALVRGLLWDPPVLVADEPLAALDPELARTCFELLCGAARRSGHAALLVVHHAGLADGADRRLRLADGRLEER